MAKPDARQVLIKFVTKLPQDLRVPDTPVAVPASLKRYGLSQIINHLLDLDPARPFDFIINDELLRKPLDAHLLQHGLSAESVLEVEYVPAVVPPKADKTALHDDWVSAVDGHLGPSQAISGSYDGCIRFWTLSGSGEASCSGAWHAHEGGVNALAVAPRQAGGALLYSGGKDHGLLMWQADGQGRHQLLATLGGHTDGVECVAVSPGGALLASGGWDGQLLVWRAGQAVADEAAEAAAPAAPAPAKRRKGKAALEEKGAAAAAAPPQGGLPQAPISLLQGPGHSTHCVAAVAWPSDDAVYSGGWDHAVRRWDVETGINTDTYNGSKAVCALATPGGGHDASQLVALGCSDKVMRLWDPRAARGAGETLGVKNCPSHAGWVVGLAWSPANQHHVASASHDGTVKVWDTRSDVPLATLSHHTDKALCVAWLGGAGDALVSGGADCKLMSYASQ